MTPRRLDPAVVAERLREIQLLLADLADLGTVDAERLRWERPTRHIVERVLSQIVELAGSINIHIVTSLLGRSPESGVWRGGYGITRCEGAGAVAVGSGDDGG